MQQRLFAGLVVVGGLVAACAAPALDPDTAVRLAREQQALAAAWASDNEVVTARLAYDVERGSALDLASADAFPRGRYLGARLMRKLDRQDGPLRLLRDYYVPASSLATAHASVEYGLRADNPNATYDAASRRVTIRVAVPVVERFQEFVERGNSTAVVKLEIGFRATDVGERLLKALDELRKEGPIDARQIDSPGDELVRQLLVVEQNMKRRETRYVRYERGDAGWQVAKLQ